MSVSKKLINLVENNPINKELLDNCTFFNLKIKPREVKIICVYNGVIIEYSVIINNYSFNLRAYTKDSYYTHIRGRIINYYPLENYEELFIQNYKSGYAFRFSDLENDQLVKLSEIISKYINIFKKYLDAEIQKASSNKEIIRLLRNINKNIFEL